MRLWHSRAAGIALACCLIAGTSLYSLFALRAMRIADEWVAHTQQVMIVVSQARAGARGADLARSDYIATGDAQFLATYHRATVFGTTALQALRALTADDPSQQRRLDRVEAMVQAEAQQASEQLATPPNPGVTPAAPRTLGPHRAATDKIRAALAEMRDVEQQLFRARTATATARGNNAGFALALGTVGSLGLIGMIFVLMAREASVREAHVRARTAELAAANAALRQNEALLRGQREQLRILIESAPAAIAMFDRDMRYLAVSHRYVADYRLDGQVLIGRSHYEVFPEIPESWRAVHRQCLGGATISADEDPFPRSDGSTDWVRWKMVPWHGTDGLVGGVILLSEVVTSRKLAETALANSEAQLRQAQKMEMIGQLTGGIAHDFNNMLAIIIGDIEFLTDRLKDDPGGIVLATEVLNTAEAGAELTRRLLAFARRQTLQPEAIDLHIYVPSVTAMLKRVLGESIRVTESLASELWMTKADQTQVGEALLNLAINARDAMPHGGEIAIAVTNAQLDEVYCAQNVEVAPGDYVLLSVTDTGIGMPADVIEHAIEPFFTTKEVGRGTGLGLSMVYGFAKQSGGHLKIYSEVGIGTTIRLYLPRAPEAAEIQAARPVEPTPPGGTEAILVVDDNARMLQVAARQLQALGYRVTTAENGPAAVVILQSGAAFDLLFTDVVMPEGISGYELADIAREIKPGIKVLLTTGYAAVHGTNGRHIAYNADARVLRKPYRRHDLANQVRAAIDDLPHPGN